MKTKSLAQIAPAVGVLLALISLALYLFLGMVWYNRDLVDTTFTGLDIVFGKQDNGSQLLVFSVFGLITVLSLLGGIVLLILPLLQKSKFFNVIAGFLLLAGGILIFFNAGFLVFESGTYGAIAKALADPTITVGAMVSGALAILAALLSASGYMLDK